MDFSTFQDVLKYLQKNFSSFYVGVFVFICVLCLLYKSFINFGKNVEDARVSLKELKKIKSDFNQNKYNKTSGLIIIVVLVTFLFLMGGIMLANSKTDKSNKELVILDENNKKIYPITVDIKKKKKVGDWTYFIYNTEEKIENKYDDKPICYPALYRYKNGENIARRVSELACYSYTVSHDCVYYLNSSLSVQSHGYLYVARPDGKNQRLLDTELYDFQIVDDKYIYYVYCFDTIGVGIDGHALHRMNLDGSNEIIAAYEVSSDILKSSNFDYKIKNGWIYYNNFKMELGNPADGLEKIVMNDIGDNEWIYYITNQLIRAKKDGSQRMTLDEKDTYDYEIEKIEGNYIYYRKHGIKYRIDTDGKNKELLEE